MACDMLLEDQMKILKHCIKHAEYDAEFAPIMVQRLIDQAEKVKQELIDYKKTDKRNEPDTGLTETLYVPP